MALLYKTFNPARTVFFALFLAVFAALPALAANPVYTVENVTVDVTADSATKARDQAFAKAQQDAFATLAGRVVGEGQAASFANTDPSTISTMIQDFEVTQEKLSSVRYVGTYTFNFDENAVRSFFGSKGTAYNDTVSPPALILPFLQKDNVTNLWGDDNVWMQAWGRAGDLKGTLPLMVPIGDVNDLADISDNQYSNYDSAKLGAMLKRYDASDAIIVMAIPDSDVLASKPGAPAKGTLSVQIFRTDLGGAELAKTINIKADGTQNVDALYDAAVTQVRGALHTGWKEGQDATADTAAPVNGQQARIDVRVYFSGLQEWARAQREIASTYGVQSVTVKSLSPSQALIDLAYRGDFENLRLALQQNRMVLSPPPALGSYPTPYDAATAPPIYDLRLNGPSMPATTPTAMPAPAMAGTAPAAGAPSNDY